jgi:hypothetical protein
MDDRISDKRVLEPLTRWMKEYTDAKSGAQAADVGNDCYPGKKVADLVHLLYAFMFHVRHNKVNNTCERNET